MPKWKKKYRGTRKRFKKKLYRLVKENKVYIPMIVETFSAYKHRTHIYKIWALMSEYPDFKARYTAELTGKMLCGRDDILYRFRREDSHLFRWEMNRL